MPNYIVSLAGYIPGVRYDAKAWTKAKIEEASTQGGVYTVIDTQNLTPEDADPSQPAARSFTTSKATLVAGWYRITFQDAEGNLQRSFSIYSSAQGSASLCGVADVKAAMQKKESDTTQDLLIEQLIPRASVAVMRDTEREFAPASTAVTRTFEFPWESELVSLAPYDLRSTEPEVTIDTDHAPTAGIVLSTEEYRVWPQPPRDGTYLSLRLRPFSAVMGRVMWRNRQVKIKGNWGFSAIPADVTHATALTVVHWMTVNVAAFRAPDENPNPEAPKRGIPPEAWELLKRYKRATLA